METREALKKAFIQQYIQKGYDQITIKELCRITPVARSTFYIYYQNLDELKQSIEDQMIDHIQTMVIQTSGQYDDFYLFFQQIITFIQEQWDIMYAFLVADYNYRFVERWKALIKKHFDQCFPHKLNNKNNDLINETIASALIGAYAYWLNYPDRFDVEQLNHIVLKFYEMMNDHETF